MCHDATRAIGIHRQSHLVSGMDSERTVLSGPLPFAIAHRGSKLLWPENTRLAFANAVEVGFRWLETDLHLSRDGHLMCIHDGMLDRTTDRSGPVSELTRAELESVDAAFHFEVGGEFAERGHRHGIPSLEDMLNEFLHCRFVVDLKRDGLAEPLWSLISRLGVEDRLIVGSFSDRRLREFRSISHGTVATSAGPRAVARALASAALFSPPMLADALQVPVAARGIPIVTERSVRKFHAAGYQVHVWTVNSSKQMHRLLDMGVDAIITDRPESLKAVLIERGAWTGA